MCSNSPSQPPHRNGLAFWLLPFALLLGLVLRCHASERTWISPPPEALKLLDLLAHGTTDVESLRDVLRPVLEEEYGAKTPICTILQVAIRRNALRGEDVFNALAKEGCPPAGDRAFRKCSIVLDLIWPYGTERGEFRAPSALKAAAPLPSLDESRATLMATRSDVVAGNFRVREPFVRGLFERADSPIRRAIELLMLKSLDELSSPADSAVIRRFASAKTPPEEVDRWALWALHRDLSGQLYEKFRYAQPEKALIAEVRALPPELIDKAFNVVGIPDSGDNLRCIFSAWRKGEQPPGEWQAWKELLLCVGWY